MEIDKKKEVVDSAFLEDDAWNISTYKLVPNLRGDPFIIGYHIPQGVGWGREWDREKRWEVPDVHNKLLVYLIFLHTYLSYIASILQVNTVVCRTIQQLSIL